MRSRFVFFTLSIYLLIALISCSKPSQDNTANDTTNASDTKAANEKGSGNSAREHQHKEAKRHIVVPAGTTITVSLGSALGSKLSQSGQAFTGTVAKEVVAENTVAIPQGASVSGSVTDAKALGKFAGGAVLAVRLDTVNIHGADLPVQAAVQTFTAKGKGKRTAVLAGGGAALGGIIGGIAGGGKGAAIGALAGGGAGTGGAALTGNKDIVLPAESAVSFQLSEPLEIR